MRQQIDIAEVEKATKIRTKYLRALENEEFHLLPGPTFVRSFLRTYADHLGLDSRVLVEEFRRDHEGLPEEEPPAAFASSPPPRRPREPLRYDRRPTPAGWIVVGTAVALLVLFLVLGLTGDPGGGSRSEEDSAQQTAKRDEDERRGERRGRDRERRDRPKSVTLRINPETGPAYACVDRGEGQAPIFEGTLTNPQSFRGKRLRLNLGRPSARVAVNGDRVDLGSASTSVGFAFAPGKKPRPLPLGQRPCA